MITTVSEQAYVFVATLYGGMIIGFIYDMYRIFRYIFRPKKIVTLIEDIFFWIVIAGVAMSVLLFSNDGQLRFYTFLGFVTGCGLYIITISSYVMGGILKILKFIQRILLSLLNMMIIPIKKLIVFMKKPLKWIEKKRKLLATRIKRIKRFPKRLYRAMYKYIKTILQKK